MIFYLDTSILFSNCLPVWNTVHAGALRAAFFTRGLKLLALNKYLIVVVVDAMCAEHTTVSSLKDTVVRQVIKSEHNANYPRWDSVEVSGIPLMLD